jgi:hypothetical protein
MLEGVLEPRRLEERAKATPFARRQLGVVSDSAKIASGDFGQLINVGQ